MAKEAGSVPFGLKVKFAVLDRLEKAERRVAMKEVRESDWF